MEREHKAPETDICVYCKERLSVDRALERVPDQPEGWQCRSLRACARRQAATRRPSY